MPELRAVCAAAPSIDVVQDSTPVWKSTSESGVRGRPGSAERLEPASPRHRAGVASMAWRTATIRTNTRGSISTARHEWVSLSISAARASTRRGRRRAGSATLSHKSGSGPCRATGRLDDLDQLQHERGEVRVTKARGSAPRRRGPSRPGSVCSKLQRAGRSGAHFPSKRYASRT